MGLFCFSLKGEKMSQCPLESVSPQQVFKKCMDLKATVINAEGSLDFEDLHYWNIGRMVFYKLRQLNYGAMNERNQTLVGMEIRINYNEPYILSIEKKPRPQYVVNLNTCYPSIDISGLIKAANTIKKGFENMFGTLRNIEIVKVIFNEPATIIIWDDGTKTVVKAQKGEVFDKEKGLAMAVVKKAFGNNGNYYNEFKKWIPED